jgi:hypothetical protein
MKIDFIVPDEPGSEIPGWFAAKLASEGRAGEVEWRCSWYTEDIHWHSLDTRSPAKSKAFYGDVEYIFRLRPAPRRRPFRMEEVPLEHWYRTKGASVACLITRVDPKDNRPIFIENGWCSLEGLAGLYEHSPTALPGTWEPCTIEEES